MANFFGSVFRFILTIITAVLLFIALVLGSLKATVFNQAYMTQQINQSGITTTIQNDLAQHIQSYGRENGIPSDVLANVLPQDLVEKNVNGYLTSLYTGSQYQLTGEDELTQNVQTALNQYAQSQGLPADNSQVAAGIQSVTQSINSSFTQYMNEQPLAQYGEKIADYQSTMTLALTVLGIVCLVLWMILMLVSPKLALKLRGTGRVIGLAGLLLLAVPFATTIGNVTTYIQLPNVEVKSFVEQLLTSFSSIFWISGGVCIAMAVLLFIISLFTGQKRGRRHAS